MSPGLDLDTLVAQFLYMAPEETDISFSHRNRPENRPIVRKQSLETDFIIYLNINQLDAINFIISLFHVSTCFEHKCSSSGAQSTICTIL